MKVGILTFHRSYNYGAFMQCFSLVKKLKKDFPDVEFEVVDYNSKSLVDRYEESIKKFISPNIKEKIKIRNKAFLPCQEQLPLSDFHLVSDDFSQLTEFLNKTYDAVIVGSDAVWNWVVRGFPNPYFLHDYKGKKLSYAASVHGMVYQNMTEEQKQYLKEAFDDFEYIGVRDVTTENMVHFVNPDLTVYHNCDPTVFLDLDEVPCNMLDLQEKMKKHGVDFSKPLVGVMAGSKIGRNIKKFWKNKIQLVNVYQPNPYSDVFLYDLSPFEWAHVFSFFKTTITHFFHGTLLTLVNRKPVAAVEFLNSFSAVNITKINDLLRRLGLSDWREVSQRNKAGLITKVLKRLNLWHDKSLEKRVNEHIKDFINSDYSNLISKKLDQEAKSYNSFRDALRNIVK